jgi:hypothetical protein
MFCRCQPGVAGYCACLSETAASRMMFASWTFSEGKMVRLAGLEPAKRVFSSLLIIAFLCAILLTFIHGFPSYVNGYFAPRGGHGQKNLCGIVRLCGSCAETGGGLNLCGNCAGWPLSLAGQSKAASWVECVRRRGVVVIGRQSSAVPRRGRGGTRQRNPSAPLPASLAAQQSGLHAGPFVEATSADLDVWQDSFCFPITQSPAADRQPCQQPFFVNETRLARRPGGRIICLFTVHVLTLLLRQI